MSPSETIPGSRRPLLGFASVSCLPASEGLAPGLFVLAGQHASDRFSHVADRPEWL